MTEQAITRTQIIVVGGVGTNDYGDLTFTDKDGGQYKVSVKRKQYFEGVITSGVAVQLNYAVYKGKEYIYSATQVKDQLPPPQQPIPPPAIQQVGAETANTKLSGDDIRNRAMAISYSKDLACAGKIEAGEITNYADKFLNWMTKSESKLVEAAKKAGAVETEKGR